MRKRIIVSRCLLCALSILSLALTNGSAVQAKTRMRVFLMCGQSNNIGIAKAAGLPDSLAQPQNNIKILGWCGADASIVGFSSGCGTPIDGYTVTGYGWQPLRPKWFASGCPECELGPAVSFGYEMQKGLPNDSIALIVGGAAPSTLAEDWQPPSAGGPGPVFKGMLKGIRGGVSNLKLTYDVSIDGMCWMQGESDAMDDYADSYKTNLAAFIKDVRDSLQTPNMPFVISMITTWPGWTFNATVRKAEVDVAASVPNVGIFDTKDFTSAAVLQQTSGHYDTQGAVKIGQGDAAAMLKLLSATSVREGGMALGTVGSKRRILQSQEPTPILISDVRGRAVCRVAANSAPDLRTMAHGVHFVTVTARGGTTTKRFTVN